MNGDGALLFMVLEALERESKRARLLPAVEEERDKLKSSFHEVQRDALFNDYNAQDKDSLLKQREEQIKDLRDTQQLLASQLKELEDLRKLRPILERQVFDKTREAQQLQERMSLQASQLTAHYATKLAQAREGAFNELEACAKRLHALLPAPSADDERSPQACELIDAMRLVVAKHMIL